MNAGHRHDGASFFVLYREKRRLIGVSVTESFASLVHFSRRHAAVCTSVTLVFV